VYPRKTGWASEFESWGARQPQVREDCRSQAGKSVGEDKGGRSQVMLL
jgi:hypothetical protein